MASCIEIFVGEVTGVEARVYAEYRAPAGDGADGGQRVTLSGRLVGPTCDYAHTLPAEFAIRDLGPGPSVLAEAVVPDPCVWTPALPHLYRIDVEARQGERVVAQYAGMFGIRRLSVRGASLVLDGRRWVVRGARRSAVADVDLAPWHGEQLAMLVADADDVLCEAASRAGVLLVAELPEDAAADAAERLARWPAVGIVVVPDRMGDRLGGGGSLPRNVLIAQRLDANGPGRPADWAHVIVCDAEHVARLADRDRPVIVVRRGGPHESCDAARAACDRLQRDLAPRLDLAGYIV